MKSFIMSMYLLTSAGGSLLGILMAPLAKYPYLVWLYLSLAIISVFAGSTFWHLFKGYDKPKDSGVVLRNLR